MASILTCTCTEQYRYWNSHSSALSLTVLSVPNYLCVHSCSWVEILNNVMKSSKTVSGTRMTSASYQRTSTVSCLKTPELGVSVMSPHALTPQTVAPTLTWKGWWPTQSKTLLWIQINLGCRIRGLPLQIGIAHPVHLVVLGAMVEHHPHTQVASTFYVPEAPRVHHQCVRSALLVYPQCIPLAPLVYRWHILAAPCNIQLQPHQGTILSAKTPLLVRLDLWCTLTWLWPSYLIRAHFTLYM